MREAFAVQFQTRPTGREAGHEDVNVDLHRITNFDVIEDHPYYLRVDHTNFMDLGAVVAQ